MDQIAFSNLGQKLAFIVATLGVLVGILGLFRAASTRYRVWSGAILTMACMTLAHLFFGAFLAPWWYWVFGLVAMGVSFTAGRFSRPIVVSAAPTIPAEPNFAKPFPSIDVLRVKLHATGDAGVTFKKKLLIILRNVGDHDILVGPKSSWVAGDLRVKHLEQLKWELEPSEGWESNEWKWGDAELPQLYVSRGRAFRTWVPTHDNATDTEIEQLRGRLGTIRLPLKMNIGNREIPL